MLKLDDHLSEIIRWREDDLGECHNEDALWGFMVRCWEEWSGRDRAVWTDPVFNRLIYMGAIEWTRGGRKPSPAAWFTTALASRLQQHIIRLETQVGVSCCRALSEG